jgi:ferredoxin-NADP reductase
MSNNPGEKERELVVSARRDVAGGVVALELRDPAGAELPLWDPGAHIDLVLSDSLIRQYSLCGDPEDRTSWRIAVLREPDGRGGSTFVHDELRENSRVRVRGPRNHFSLDHAPAYLFVAGGIGITPILAMVRAAVRAGAVWRLIYSGRQLASMAFRDELHSDGPQVEFWPKDERGYAPVAEAIKTVSRLESPLVYCCGPEGLLAAVATECEVQGISDQLRIERFKAGVEDSTPADSFNIVLDRSGLELTVPPSKSIMEVCREAGVEVDSSCEAGICSTCETGVLSGVPDHRDSVLTRREREAGKIMLVCVSRSVSDRLVLDL